MEECYLDKKIYYRKNKFKSNQRTIFFVHGVSGSSSAWKKYEDKFKDKYNIICLDLRGHGKSFKFKHYNDYKIEKFTEDIINIVKKEKIKKFVLICHSFAVFIGLDFINKYQKYLESAVLLSPATSPPKNIGSKIVKKFLDMNIVNKININRDFGNHIDYSRFPNSGDWSIPRMIEDVGNTSLKIYLWSSKQTYNIDFKNILKNIKIPVLLVHGKKDSIFSYKNSIVMNREIKNSNLKILPESNHILVLNNFREVSGLIEKFIEN